MRRLIVGLTMVVVLLAPAGALAATGGVTDAAVLKQLAAVRQATAKYHDVAQAEADGYVSTEECTALPDGSAGMGVHYINFGLASDLTVDPLAPEALLYMPTGGGLRLVGVEYFEANAGQSHPSLFGQSFDGPMAGHFPGMPEHYDLHVWVWQANPDGTFAQFNPNVRCGE